MADTSIGFLILAKDQASGTFTKVGRSADSASSRVGKFGKIGKAALAGAAGAAMVAGKAMFDLAKAAMVDEASQKRLAVVVRNVTGASAAQAKGLDQTIQKMSLASGIADDELREAYSGLLLTTKDATLSHGLLKTAMDVSAGSGKDLGAVVEALTGAARGEMDAIESLGVKTENAAGKTLSLKNMSGQLNEMFGGSLKAQTETTAGKMQRLRNALDEAKESIGAKLLPYALKLSDWFLNKGIPASEKFLRKLKPVGEWMKSHKPVVIALGAAIGLLVAPFAAVGVGLVALYAKSKTFRDVTNGAFQAVGATGRWLWNNVFRLVFKLILGGIGGLMLGWSKLLSGLGHVPGFGWAKTAGDKMEAAGRKALDLADNLKKIPNEKRVKVSSPGLQSVINKWRELKGIILAIPAIAAAGIGAAAGVGAVGRNMRGRGLTQVGLLEQLFPNIENSSVKVKTALAKVRGFIEAERNKIASLKEIRTGFLSTFKGGSIFGTDTSGASDPLAAMLAEAERKRDRARRLQDAVKKLVGMGLSKNLLQQMQESGEGGIDQILALSGGNSAQIAALNQMNAQEQAALNSAGLVTGNAIRGGDIDADIKRHQDALAIAQALAKTLDAINDELHIHLEGETIVKSVKRYNRRKGQTTAGL